MIHALRALLHSVTVHDPLYILDPDTIEEVIGVVRTSFIIG